MPLGCSACIRPEPKKLPTGVIGFLAAMAGLFPQRPQPLRLRPLERLRFRRTRAWEKDIQQCRPDTWEEIIEATNNFGERKLSRKGAFRVGLQRGCSRGETVAVKRASRVVIGSEGKGSSRKRFSQSMT